MQQIEEEILNELRGLYKTSFYSIYLNGTYDEDISKMSTKDQGTLLHEYIHYLQNISTPWGIHESRVIYYMMYQSLNTIVANNPISIPTTPKFPEQFISLYKKLKATYGTKSLEEGKEINWERDIIVKFSQEIIDNTEINKPYFDVFLTNGDRERIEIGALIVMETMSALYQSLIDSEAKHPDVPYNVIIKYCQKYYPKLALDTRKLICLCYASLFTLCPGTQLIHLIKEYGNSDEIDGLTAFDQFINNYQAGKKEDGTPRTIVEFVDEMIDKFKKMLSNILTSKLEFLNVIFDPIRLSEKWVPAVSALYDDGTPFSLDYLKTMIKIIGLPHLYTSEQQYCFPTVVDRNEPSTDLVELITLQAIYTYFTRTDKNKECMLSYMCKGDKYSEDHCKNHPWSQEIECPFSVTCKAHGIDKKTINNTIDKHNRNKS